MSERRRSAGDRQDVPLRLRLLGSNRGLLAPSVPTAVARSPQLVAIGFPGVRAGMP